MVKHESLSAASLYSEEESGAGAVTPFSMSRRRTSAERQRQSTSAALVTTDENTTPFLEREDEENFDLMNVTITLYGLSGVMCVVEDKKDKRSPIKGFASKRCNKSKSFNDTCSRTSGNPIKTDSTLSENSKGFDGYYDFNPTRAVASFQKNAIGSETSIETHLPSFPLDLSRSTTSSQSRFSAAWPSQASVLLGEEDQKDRSSFSLIRVLKQELYVPGQSKTSTLVSNYVHETIDIQIGLCRGKELIPLGTGSLVISGDEEAEVMMNIPVKPRLPEKQRRTPKKLFKAKCTEEINKNGYFVNDTERKFTVSENAVLRVGVRVVPYYTATLSQARDTLHTGITKKSGANGMPALYPRGRLGKSNHSRCLRDPLRESLSSDQTAPRFFCGNVQCSPAHSNYSYPIEREEHVPKEVFKRSLQHLRDFPDTVISSVSESTDGSEAESDAWYSAAN